MPKTIADGVWPTMITPFTEDNRVDPRGLESLIEWYMQRKVDGLFAVCQSSEMFMLSLKERLALARSVISLVGGRVPVIASGHVADSLDDQIEEAKMMADTGIDSLVLVTNRFARAEDTESTFKKNLEVFLEAVPGRIPLGFYECPHPYKRVLSGELTRWIVETGRFGFLKDTSCRLDNMRSKAEAAKGSAFKLFNANAATLLSSLKLGFSGYCGIMTNFHADLYVWLCRNWKTDEARASALQDYLGLASIIEYQLYPANAMYYLGLEGLPIALQSRRCNPGNLTASMKVEVEEFRSVSQRYSSEYPLA